MITYRTVLVVVLSAVLTACAHAPPAPAAAAHAPAAAKKPAAGAPHSPWDMLRAGEVGLAMWRFKAWMARPGERSEGLAGLLAVARVSGDDDAIRKMLLKVDPKTASPLLLVQAATAAVTLDALSKAGAALLARACKLTPSSDVSPEQIAELCSDAAVFRAAKQVDRCTAGCKTGTKLPMIFVGHQPAVMASVNGEPKAAFIVDTGASTSLVSKAYAAKHGIHPIPGSSFRVESAGSFVKADRALVTLTAGGVTIENVPVILLDLPMGSVAGLISPHTTWSGFAVEYDFRSFTLGLSQYSHTGPDLATLPFFRADRNPVVVATVGDRPARPLMVDTGAWQSVLFTRFDTLGKPLVREHAANATGAGGSVARAWTTSEKLEVHAGALSWSLVNPAVVERAKEPVPPTVQTYGLVGMDFLMGRRFIVDSPAGRLFFSKEAKLPPWPVGDSATWKASGTLLPAPVTVHEKVVARTPRAVTLDVTIDGAETPEHFRLEMPDTWATRGTWLVTRPATKMWDVGAGGKLVPVPPTERASRWLAAFTPFRTAGHAPAITIAPETRAGAKIYCTTIAVDAVAGKKPARLSFTECPKDVWRTQSVELRAGKDGKGAVLWSLVRSAP